MLSLAQLLPRWVAEATEPLPPQPAEMIRQVFESLGSVATLDVLALYSSLGGMRMMDNEYWRLWPLDEIAGQSPSEFGVLFSDYCISCWEYRLRPVDSDHSAVYVDHFDGSAPVLVAATLEEFFDRYTSAARSLLDAGSVSSKGDAQPFAAADGSAAR
jgi:hypothetical protein